jgi:hypothetical protein
MTKGELLESLSGLMDDTEVVVCVQGKEVELLKAKYVPSADENVAYVMLVGGERHG